MLAIARRISAARCMSALYSLKFSSMIVGRSPDAGGEVKILARLFGGQGTMNVPSWSPDGTSIAFVSYRLPAP